ncbi:MAG TPA: DNA polymerase ligase N-terminal domain-containing protein [Thermoanaerobaculia bacterium]|nr:DNA polymerase ligase N-terminal domain-containing protein [Thermoanaerobaculia bacterium]
MVKQLDKYQKMRDFGVTPEPSGKTSKAKKSKKLIFVVQKHQASHLHYDFRLEMEGVLKSWAVPKGPSYDPSVKRLAMMTEDHPYDYAGFEGIIPSGNYGGGNVIVWDKGTWEFIEPGDDPVAAVRKGKLTFSLDGKKLKGEWALVQLKGPSQKGNEWLLLKHRDGYASSDFDITEEAPLSILSGRSVEEVDPQNVWQSNRSAAGKPQTVASALKKQAAAKKRAAVKRKAKPPVSASKSE